jgi:HJR/Mrr/RecB family endonuclease
VGSLHDIDGDKAIVVTSSSFSNPAKDYASDAPVEIWNCSKLKREISNIDF